MAPAIPCGSGTVSLSVEAITMTEPTLHSIYAATLGIVALSVTLYLLSLYLSYRFPLTF
jgi:hypothetical protein